MAAGYSELTNMSYTGSVDNSGNGVRARFNFQGIDGGGNLAANTTWPVSLNNTGGPYTMILDKSTSEQLSGVTAKILTATYETAQNVSGTLELYPLTAGTTYTFNSFDTAFTPEVYFDFTPTLDETPKTKSLASGTLVESISASSTSLSVYVGAGSATTIRGVWPNAPFYATLMPSNPTAGVANSLDSEIVKVTAIDNDQVGNTTLTVVRGQRGTTAKAFSANAIVTNGVFMDDILNRIYPIGSIFMSVSHSTVAQVEEALGGTWEAWGAGRVPVGVNTSDTDFDTVEETGGEKTHTLASGETPKRDFYVDHISYGDNNYGAIAGVTVQRYAASGANRMQGENAGSTSNAWRFTFGNNEAHNNLQPYITCYMYKRIA